MNSAKKVEKDENMLEKDKKYQISLNSDAEEGDRDVEKPLEENSGD